MIKFELIGAVVILACFVLYGILSVVTNGLKNAVESFILGIGKKSLNLKVHIPPKFEKDIEFKNKGFYDEQKILLSNYNPRVSGYQPYIKAVYQPVIYTRQEIVKTNQVNYDAVKEILVLSKAQENEAKSFPLKDYPIPPPNKPSEVDSPPKWTPWQISEQRPFFKPPYYKGILSVFNSCVDFAYRDEINRLKDLQLLWEKINNVYSDRNEAIKRLWEQAEIKYTQAVARQNNEWVSKIEQYRADKAEFLRDQNEEKKKFDKQAEEQKNIQLKISGENGCNKEEALVLKIKQHFKNISISSFVENNGDAKYDRESGILIYEHQFPDLAALDFFKLVNLKSGLTRKPLNQTEKKDIVGRIYPSLSIRLAAEIARLDDNNSIKAVVINGWANFIDKATGQQKTAYCCSLYVSKEQILSWNLEELDPIAAFSALKGNAAKNIEITPIAPMLSISTSDDRFVEAKEVLGNLDQGENIAAMDWEDFEHLCRQLFEKAFAEKGAEVKVTQASRDQGVDAVIFDPDPLTGGKIVVQAKRYTNVVDVSAVRDLYGTCLHEGAMKGILVTTSHFGHDSYNFVKDKPITLINGSQMLGLLEKFGYKFRINLEEARGINASFGRV
jgi:restriction system protein